MTHTHILSPRAPVGDKKANAEVQNEESEKFLEATFKMWPKLVLSAILTFSGTAMQFLARKQSAQK